MACFVLGNSLFSARRHTPSIFGDFVVQTVDKRTRQGADDLGRVENKLEELGLDPAKYDIAILPACVKRTEKVSARRKKALADRLAGIAAELRLEATHEPAVAPKTSSAPLDTAYMMQACATCRGDCCRSGGEKAHLTKETFRRVLAAFPELSLDDLVREYLDRVPENAYAKSCIYHGENGCALPVDKRSDTCNDFYCTGARVLSDLVTTKKSPPVLTAALKGERIVRLAVLDGREMKYLFES